jgi:hypothetical protein
MNLVSAEMLLGFCSSSTLQVNLIIFLNLFGALLLGCLVGWRRACRSARRLASRYVLLRSFSRMAGSCARSTGSRLHYGHGLDQH